MNTWNISSIITNRASNHYSEHSKREYHEPHKDLCDWQDWGLTLETLPPRGGGSAECPKKDKRRVRRGSREQKTHNTQINLNNWKIGEPQVYFKLVEQTLYSAAVPINKNVRIRVWAITMCIYACVSAHVSISEWKRWWLYVCMYMHACLHMYLLLNENVDGCMFACMYACL